MKFLSFLLVFFLCCTLVAGDVENGGESETVPEPIAESASSKGSEKTVEETHDFNQETETPQDTDIAQEAETAEERETAQESNLTEDEGTSVSQYEPSPPEEESNGDLSTEEEEDPSPAISAPDDDEQAAEIYRKTSAEKTTEVMVGLFAIIFALYVTLYVTNRWQDVIYFLSRLRQQFQSQETKGYGRVDGRARGPAMPDAYDYDDDEDLRKLEEELLDVSLSDGPSDEIIADLNDGDFSLDSSDPEDRWGRN